MPFEKISTTLVHVHGPKPLVRVSIQDLTFGCVESAEINQSAGLSLSYPQASDEFRCLVAAHLPGTVKAISMTVLKSEQFFKVVSVSSSNFSNSSVNPLNCFQKNDKS